MRQKDILTTTSLYNVTVEDEFLRWCSLYQVSHFLKKWSSSAGYRFLSMMKSLAQKRGATS